MSLNIKYMLTWFMLLKINLHICFHKEDWSTDQLIHYFGSQSKLNTLQFANSICSLYALHALTRYNAMRYTHDAVYAIQSQTV